MEGDGNDELFSSSSSSPNKRQKTTNPPLSSSKGKEKIEEIIEIEDESENESNGSDPEICGICFEEGKSIRGWIDSCNHYFCFVCIMEWSKVESRCPLCKQRFKTILRKPKNGVFLQERVVNVPFRNQVCHPLGNQTTEVSDPYAQVNCTVCQNSSDDHLLLLCDLCDSASHTYCVGLGNTVPEGDWFCHDCTLLRNEHSSDTGNQDLDFMVTDECAVCQSSSDDHLLLLCDLCDSAAHTYCVGLGQTVPEGDWFCHDCTLLRNEQSSDTGNQDSDVSVTTSCDVTNHSISEIVQESRPQNIRRPARRKTSSTRSKRSTSHSKRSASRASGRNLLRSKRRLASRAAGRNLTSTSAVTTRPNQLSSRVSGRDVSSTTAVTDSSARTLSHCRNVHSRIRVLRQNWGALRNGSVSFFANTSKSNGKNDKKRGTSVSYVNSSELRSSSSMNCKENPTNDNASDDMLNNKNPYNVNRAWRMLDIAKSVQIACEARSSNQGSNHKPGNQDLTKASRYTSPTISLSRSKIVPQKDLGRIAPKKDGCQFVEMPQQENRSQVLKEMRPKKNPTGTPCFQRTPTNHTSRACELPSVKQVHILDQVQPSHRNGCDDTRASSNMNRKPDLHASSYSKEELPKEGGVNEICAKINARKDEGAKSEVQSLVKLPKEGGVNEICAKINVRKDEGAKSEVQSLVKLNLKLLGRDKPLGVNGFKEVARLATHTVLAACGLEHKESSVRPFPNSICKHKDTTKQLRMSNLMPTSCRECFYGFVKDVVSSIAAQETALTK